LLRRNATRAALAILISCAAGTAWAGPDDSSGPLPDLLADHGVAESTGVTPPAPLAAATVTEPSVLRRVHERAGQMVVAAMDFVGVRYRRGGVSADTGFDCSGFTRHVFETSLGLMLPRRADEQAAAPGLVAVKRDELQPGDLVFFNTLKRTFSHVGIYIGDNRFIHSPRPGKLVRTDDISFAYWSKRFTGARRVQVASTIAPAEQPPAPAEASSGE
jgi:cell wall-associated NlpC family hydrolase